MDSKKEEAKNNQLADIKVALIGIPYDSNSSFLRGPSYAPPRIRLMDKDGSANSFAESGLPIFENETYIDKGDLAFPTTDPMKDFIIIRDTIAKQIKTHKVLSLGGDHSVTYPIIKALSEKYPILHILHIDAHSDLYDNFDDNPYSHASPFARIMENKLCKSLTQVGIRTMSPPQMQQVIRFGVKQIQMKDFSYDFIKDLKGPLYISLDLDSLDPAFALGVSHHEPGGLSVREVLNILQKIPTSVEIVGADIVEYNPTRDHQNMTAMVAYKCMKEFVALLNR
jgi:arginase